MGNSVGKNWLDYVVLSEDINDPISAETIRDIVFKYKHKIKEVHLCTEYSMSSKYKWC